MSGLGSNSEPQPAAPQPVEAIEAIDVEQEAADSFARLRQLVISAQTEHPYLATVAETTATWAVRRGARSLAESATGLGFGHGWHESELGKRFARPTIAVASALILAPLAEEAAFRKLPSEMLDQRGKVGLQPLAGYAAATIFAVGHAGRESIPASQFIGGLNYWRLMRSRGMSHAVLAHATHNALCLGASYLSRKKQL